MERLTDKMLTKACNDPWDYCGLDAHCTRHCTQPTPCKIPALVHRLAKIENILGDNYDLERLKEAVKLIDKLERGFALDVVKRTSGDYAAAFAEIAHAPAADVVEVRHAHWEFPVFTDSDDGLDPRVKCSECGGIEAAFARWKYCPNCGARIDKGANHEISKP